MLKKIILLLLTICMTVCFCLTAQARSLSRAELYAALQEELHRYLDGDDAMTLEDMVTQFMELGAYKKSMAFGLYASILRDVEAGEYSNLMMYTEILRLDEDFSKLLADEENPYPSVNEIEAYALGRQAEEAEDWAAAVVYYEQSIAVLDSMMRMTQIRMAGLAELPTPTPMPTVRPTATPTPRPTKTPTSTPRPTATPRPGIWGYAIKPIATSYGPGAKYNAGAPGYEELQYTWVRIIARAYDTNGGIWWVKFEAPNGEYLWTGYHRFDEATLSLYSIPVESGW